MKRIGQDWATPVTHQGWGAVAVVTQWLKKVTRYRLGVHVHHFAWERSHGDRSRRHPWQSLWGAS